MITDREKAELLEMSRSEALRRDFRRLRAPPAAALPAEEFLRFLTAFSGLCPAPVRPIRKAYVRVLL